MGLTQDMDWLTRVQDGFDYSGKEFILEMARFWESRPTFSEEKQQWEINGLLWGVQIFFCVTFHLFHTDVMPPDENQEHANNSIFTNMVANLAVSTARWTTCLADGQAASEQEIPDEWMDKMKNLVFLYNADKEYHEEFEGFDEQYTSGKSGKHRTLGLDLD